MTSTPRSSISPRLQKQSEYSTFKSSNEWLNGRWIREKLDDERFLDAVAEWATEGGLLRSCLLLAKSRTQKLSDLPKQSLFLLTADLEPAHAPKRKIHRHGWAGSDHPRVSPGPERL